MHPSDHLLAFISRRLTRHPCTFLVPSCRYANSLAGGGGGGGGGGGARGLVLNTAQNVTFEDPRVARRKQLMDFNEVHGNSYDEVNQGSSHGSLKKDHDDDDKFRDGSEGGNEGTAGVTLRRRPKYSDNGVAAREARKSSVYEESVAASLSTLEKQLIQVSKDEWALKHPGQNPDKSPHWLMLEEQLKQDFAEKFKTAERRRKTFNEEVRVVRPLSLSL
jgi:hypothetical protein